jgi:colanic acid biosynthesis glycosyl transferase WcaI
MLGETATGGHAKRLAILYHYMHPDDVVSALHLDGLAQDLAEKGWVVEAFPCNRGCRDETKIYPLSEHYRGVSYRRIWRPRFRQKSFLGRLANSAWMITAWSTIAFRRKSSRPNIVVIGTDPVFAVATAIFLKALAPKIKIAHWCFDMHPEASIVSGALSDDALLVRMTRLVVKQAYRSCDMIADLGACMRARLRLCDHAAQECELTPWALVEPETPVASDPQTRRELFGNACLGILYSGNFGEAHDFQEFLALARSLRGHADVHFCFAVRGNRADELRNAVTDADTNISFAGFADINELEKRLGSADIHLISLKKEWAGVAVPSKFFGSIASGRPILYSGSRHSAIGQWIVEHNVGWIIDPENIEQTSCLLAKLARDVHSLDSMKVHCNAVYAKFFSKKRITDIWDEKLKNLLDN